MKICRRNVLNAFLFAKGGFSSGPLYLMKLSSHWRVRGAKRLQVQQPTWPIFSPNLIDVLLHSLRGASRERSYSEMNREVQFQWRHSICTEFLWAFQHFNFLRNSANASANWEGQALKIKWTMDANFAAFRNLQSCLCIYRSLLVYFVAQLLRGVNCFLPNYGYLWRSEECGVLCLKWSVCQLYCQQFRERIEFNPINLLSRVVVAEELSYSTCSTATPFHHLTNSIYGAKQPFPNSNTYETTNCMKLSRLFNTESTEEKKMQQRVQSVQASKFASSRKFPSFRK